MTTARYVTYHQYAGFLVRGTEPVTISAEDQKSHIRRAAALTSMLECVHWGTVQSFDGAGMSGGLLHHIAVQPHSLAQGSLWELLSAISIKAPTEYAFLGVALAPWKIVRGVLRDEHGAVVTGQAIRCRLNGSPDGKTPPGDLGARGFALMFSRLLSDPATFPIQLEYAIDWLVRSQEVTERNAYAGFHVSELGPRSAMPPELDLAMCVYHAFSANGPGPARDILKTTFASNAGDSKAFARKMIRAFGMSNFGRWHDDPLDEGSRYDATRGAVLRSGFWPRELVDQYMPKNLV